MRNPCDLYVSFANYNPNKAYGYVQTRGENPLLGRRVGMLEVSEFEKWLLNSSLLDGTGFYSFYFWQSVIQPECHNFWKLPNDKRRELEDRCENATLMQKQLRDFSPTSIAHCWIFQETMMDDFRVC